MPSGMIEIGDETVIHGHVHIYSSFVRIGKRCTIYAHTAIGTDGYPTRAARPKNSLLDCSKLKRAFGVELPHWQTGVALCVKRLLEQPAA